MFINKLGIIRMKSAISFRKAIIDDLKSIVDLLADDVLGAAQER